MSAHLDRTYSPEAPSQPPTSPTLLYTLPQLEENLKVRCGRLHATHMAQGSHLPTIRL